MLRWLGIDVGGANLKLASENYGATLRFELWRHPGELTVALRAALAAAPAWDALAATMTGELADCYETKADGVRHITASLLEAANGRPVVVYRVDGALSAASVTLDDPLPAAASNWHALARYAANWLPEKTGVVIDIGSTTTDIVLVERGEVVTTSRTDSDRLQTGELVYAGVGRTPLCALVSELPLGPRTCPTAAEVFATTADVYQLLNLRDASQEVGADGRPLAVEHCVDRLARQVCADRETFRLHDAIAAASYVYGRQRELLQVAFERVLQAKDCGKIDVVISGSGEFLARTALENHPRVESMVLLSACTGRMQSHCAAAAAVAHLAQKDRLLERR